MKTYTQFKKFLTEGSFFGEYAEISDKKNFDVKNPEVNVKGVGKYKLKKLKENIVKKLEDAIRIAKKGEYEHLREVLNQNSLLQHFVNAVIDVDYEMSTPEMKRKVTMLKKEAASRDEIKKNILNEVAPPDEDIEQWIKSVKPEFLKKYGKEKGTRILYSAAWKKFNQKS